MALVKLSRLRQVRARFATAFDLNIVPHTVQETNVGDWAPGVKLNLEVDVLARYLERLMMGERAAQSTAGAGITLAMLAENGYGSH